MDTDNNSGLIFTTGSLNNIISTVPSSAKRNINIYPKDFGYLVEIGCQTVAIETVDKLIRNLESYLKNPQEYEKKWMSDSKKQLK